MSKSRTILCGDIHGCLDEFTELIKKISYNKNSDRIIILGDLLDRGPDSIGCIRLAREMNLECVIGNHEHKFIKWYKNRGTKSVHDGKPYYDKFTDADINFILRMNSYIEIPEYRTVAVHAGLRGGIPLQHQSKDDLYYIRYMDSNKNFISLKKINQLGKTATGAHFWTDFGPFEHNIVYGHQVWEKPRIDYFYDNTKCIGIDLGCVFGGSLCAYILETNEFITVKSKKIYFESKYSNI